MKKSLVVILSMLFVLGLAVSAFAIHAEIPAETQATVAKGATQITLGGSLRLRGDLRDNTTDFDADNADYRSYYDTRVRLSLDAQVTPNTMGRVQLESGDNTHDTYVWGKGGQDARGLYPVGNGKQGVLSILEAWVQHTGSGLLGVPAGIKVGHMPLQLGNSLFFDHSKFGDDAVLLIVDPTKELHVVLLDAKFRESNAFCGPTSATSCNDDSDAYVLIGAYSGGSFNVSGDATYVNDQPAAPGGLHFWNFGLRGDGKVSMVNLKADVELQAGKAKDAAAPGDVKFSGWAFLVGADVALDMVTLDAAIGYGSGDSNVDDDNVKTFVTSLSDTQYSTYVYGYRVMTAAGLDSNGNTQTGIANTTYYKVGASAKPMPDLSAKVDVYLLRATKLDPNVFSVNEKDVGVEADAKITYQIDKNFVYFVEGGYLWAGDFYKNVTGASKDPDNPWVVRHGVELTF